MPHPSLTRYLGLAGSLTLAVSAYLGGALPALPPRVNPVTIWQGENGPLILGLWLVGTALLTRAWWAARNGDLPTRWVLVTVALWLLPLLFAPPLGSRDSYAYACQGATYAAGLNPYHQGVSALPCPWLDSISLIWRDTPAPYGPLFVLISGGVVATGASLPVIVGMFRVIALAGVVLTAACLPVLARRCGVPVGRALWLALACPLVAVHLVSGAHNDALMIGLLVAGLAVTVVAADRPTGVGRPATGVGRAAAGSPPDPGHAGPAVRWWAGGPVLLTVAGLLLGLAVAIKVTALVVVPFVVLLGMVGPYRVPALLRAAVPVVGGTVVAVVGTTLVAGLDFGWAAGLSRSGDAIAWTSPPTAVGQTFNYLAVLFGWHVDGIPVARAVGMAVLAVLLVVLWWRARTSDPLHHAGLALTATVALSPVVHPWYVTWPLALLAVTTLRNRWMPVVALVACFLVLPDGTGLPRYTKMPGAPLMTLLVIVVAVRLLRSVRADRRAAAVSVESGLGG